MLIAVAADKGAPGVTTTALALAAVWPRPVLLAECDPAGGDLVYRLPGEGGGRLDPRRGLLSLAVAARRDLQPTQLWTHAQKLRGGLDVLLGVTSAEQGAGLEPLWGPVGSALAGLPQADVIADCGRLGPDGAYYDLLAHAAAVVLVTRPSLGEVVRLRDRAAAVALAVRQRSGQDARVGVLVVADHRVFSRALAEVGQVLGAVGVLGGIAFEPRSAELLRGEWGGRLDKSLLIRTAREVAGQLAGPPAVASGRAATGRRAAAAAPARGRPGRVIQRRARIRGRAWAHCRSAAALATAVGLPMAVAALPMAVALATVAALPTAAGPPVTPRAASRPASRRPSSSGPLRPAILGPTILRPTSPLRPTFPLGPASPLGTSSPPPTSTLPIFLLPSRAGGDGMDHTLVKRLRGEVGVRLAEQRRLDASGGLPPMSGEDERQFARALIAQVLEDHARNEITAGRVPPNAQEEEDLAAGIHAALFGVGRLQPLLDGPHIENIDINGCDRVFVGYADGREVMVEPVAENDDELVELIQVLAAYSGLSSRPFDSANPQLDLRLPDGARLSAVMDVTLRPAVSIRRARLGKVFLADLVGNGTLLPEAAAFLAAAAGARKNIMIAGATNAGKTTLLRAIVNEIPPHERLITVERALELGIDHFPELHPNVVAFEERLPNMEGQGAISMAELVRRSLRMNPSRVIVGEVLGDEIVTMLNAMSQGNDGSLSTIHANSSLEVFNRIATYAIQSAERLPVEATHMLIAGAIDFVVFVEKRNEYQFGGRLRRFVSSIREVTGVDGRVLSSEVFAPGPDGRAVPRAPVSCLGELAMHGYDPARGAW